MKAALGMFVAAIMMALVVSPAEGQSGPSGYLGTVHLVVGDSPAAFGYSANNFGTRTGGNLPGPIFTDGLPRAPIVAAVNRNGTPDNEADDFLVLTALAQPGESLSYKTASGLRYLRVSIRAGEGQGNAVAEANLWASPSGIVCPGAICATLHAGTFAGIGPGSPMAMDFFDSRAEALGNAAGGEANLVVLAALTQTSGGSTLTGTIVEGELPAALVKDKPTVTLTVETDTTADTTEVSLVASGGEGFQTFNTANHGLWLLARNGAPFGETWAWESDRAEQSADNLTRTWTFAGANRFELPAALNGTLFVLQVENQFVRRQFDMTPGGAVAGQLILFVAGFVIGIVSTIVLPIGLTFKVSAGAAMGVLGSAMPLFWGSGSAFVPGGIILIIVAAAIGIFFLARRN